MRKSAPEVVPWNPLGRVPSTALGHPALPKHRWSWCQRPLGPPRAAGSSKCKARRHGGGLPCLWRSRPLVRASLQQNFSPSAYDHPFSYRFHHGIVIIIGYLLDPFSISVYHSNLDNLGNAPKNPPKSMLKYMLEPLPSPWIPDLWSPWSTLTVARF